MQQMGLFLSDVAREANAGWYAIYTRHQHEKTVERLLADKGFEIFFPVQTVLPAGGKIGPRSFRSPYFPATFSFGEP
jgi:Transcription termination factor nusG